MYRNFRIRIKWEHVCFLSNAHEGALTAEETPKIRGTSVPLLIAFFANYRTMQSVGQAAGVQTTPASSSVDGASLRLHHCHGRHTAPLLQRSLDPVLPHRSPGGLGNHPGGLSVCLTPKTTLE